MKVRPLFYEMRVECAWCGKYLCMSKCVKPGQVSHGICPGCSEQLLAESEEYQAAIRARENESLSLTV
jgi:hypothetical protein